MFHRLVTIALALLLTCANSLAQGQSTSRNAIANHSQDPSGRQQVLRISRQTTRITSPLDKQGFVDYLQAANDLASRDVTLANNFEVVVRETLGPSAIPEELRTDYYRRLGLALGESGSFVTWSTFLEQQGQLPEELEKLHAQYDAAVEKPWQADRYPVLAAWLREVDASLDQVVAGTRRPKYYTPYLADSENDLLLGVLLPSLAGQRELARSLRIRANANLGAGRTAAAWNDTLTLYRMGRLTAQGMFLIERLVGSAIDAYAFETAVDVLRSPHLTGGELRQFRADLERLSAIPALAEKIDLGERFMGLDAVQTLSRQGGQNLLENLRMIQALSRLESPTPVQLVTVSTSSFPQTCGAATETAEPELNVDWNVAAELLNREYDRMVAADREPTAAARRGQLARIRAELKGYQAELQNGLSPCQQQDEAEPRSLEAGRLLGKLLATQFMPSLENTARRDPEPAARRALLTVASAIEQYRREQHRTPVQLEALVPAYLATLPIDPFSGKSPVYRPMADEILLFSVGSDGQLGPDAGNGDSDDIVIRLKLKAEG